MAGRSSLACSDRAVRSPASVVRGRRDRHLHLINNFLVLVDKIQVDYGRFARRLANRFEAVFEMFQAPSETSADHTIAIPAGSTPLSYVLTLTRAPRYLQFQWPWPRD
jgi:hypothetical protein